MPIKSFSLTHVEYNSDDPFGFILALITLSPIFIMVMYATLIAFKRDFDTLLMLCGQLLSEFINLILKRVLKQPRPSEARMDGNGMPSAHSQFIVFFATYSLMFLAKRVYSNRKWEKIFAGIGVYTLSLMVAYSRYHLGYHSLDQILVGILVGTTLGMIWFFLVDKLFRKYFVVMESWSISKSLLLRDYSHISDVIEFDHQCVQKYNKLYTMQKFTQ